jgi:hypothetical protein
MDARQERRGQFEPRDGAGAGDEDEERGERTGGGPDRGRAKGEDVGRAVAAEESKPPPAPIAYPPSAPASSMRGERFMRFGRGSCRATPGILENAVEP